MHIRRYWGYLDVQVLALGMFVSNEIPNFKAFLQKSIYSFTTRLSFSSSKFISAIEQSWIMKSLIWKTWEKKMYI